MSGYNAEYSAPRETELEDLPATLAPIVLGQPIESAPIQMGENVETVCEKIQSRESFTAEERQNLTNILKSQRDMIHKLRTEDISADDYRLTHIWESASEIADRRGYCDVFDSIMEEIGTGYTREMEWCVTVTETIKYDVHVTAPRNATQSDIEELIQYETLSDHNEIERDWEVDNYESAD